MTKIIIPLNPFKAVYKATSTCQTRRYLGGVFVQDDRIVATNGHTLLRYVFDDHRTGVVTSPFILKVDVNEKAMKPKHSEDAYMHVDLERLIIETYLHDPETGEIGKRIGVCAFEVVDGVFPDYKRVIPDNTKNDDLVEIAFDAAYVADFAAAAKLMGVKPVLRFVSGMEKKPANVLFSGVPQMDGVIMPHKF